MDNAYQQTRGQCGLKQIFYDGHHENSQNLGPDEGVYLKAKV